MALRIKFLLLVITALNICSADCRSESVVWKENSDQIFFHSLSQRHSEYGLFSSYLKSSGGSAESFRKAVEPLVNRAFECVLFQQISPESPFEGYLLYRLTPSGNWQFIKASSDMKPTDIDPKFNETVTSLVSDAGEIENKVDFYGYRTLDATAAFVTIKAKSQIIRFAAYPAKTSASIFDSSALKLIARTSTVFANIELKK